MIRVVVLATGLTLAAGAAGADPLPAEAARSLRSGQTWISVTLDADGSAARIQAAIDIPAAPDRIWRAMTDCGATMRMVRSIIGCRVLRAGAGWDIREHVTRGGPLLPSFRYTVRSDYEPLRRIRFRKVDGDVRTLEGEWGLTPRDGGRVTRVTYENRVSARVLAPALLVRAKLRADTPKVLENLRALVAGGQEANTSILVGG